MRVNPCLMSSNKFRPDLSTYITTQKRWQGAVLMCEWSWILTRAVKSKAFSQTKWANDLQLSLNPLATNDDYSHRNSAACYQLAQSVLKIGWFCASRKVGQGEVCGSTTLADRAWQLLQLAIENAWSALDGPLFCFLVQMSVRNSPFTL